VVVAAFAERNNPVETDCRMPRNFEELTPQNFSFNSPLGWCPACQGLGVEQGTNLSILIPSVDRSLLDGAVALWPNPRANPYCLAILNALASELGIPIDVPYRQLDARHQRIVLYGSGERWLNATLDEADTKPADAGASEATPKRRPSKRAAAGTAQRFTFQYKGLYPAIEEATRVSFEFRQALGDLVGETVCSECHGARIRDDAAAVRLRDRTLPQVAQLPLKEALGYFESLTLSSDEKKIAGDLLNEVIHRLRFLVDVGLEYLTLDRPMPTLSGGESQRIRLAGQIGRALTGVLYVLDEPTIGLHPRDNHRLISALHRLRDLGNTVVLVEHDREVLDAADRLYDFGPGSGRHGGQIVAQGAPAEFGSGTVEGSLTADYLSGKKVIPIPKTRRIALRKSVQPTSEKPAATSPPPAKKTKKRTPSARKKPATGSKE
jgi:excinuclease ABC subunit A